MKELLTLLSAGLILLAAPPYIIDTVKGKTRPERITWLIFSILGIIAFVSQLSLGGTWSLVFSGMDTLASITVFILSLRFGVGGFTRLDISALFIATVGVLIAIIAKQPVISIAGVILADLSGAALTVRKTYLQPKSETMVSWLLVGTASLLGVLTVGKMSLGLLMYPVYLMLVNYSVPVAALLGTRRMKVAK